jgi:NAD(P)H dehydrogenase (quinone)
MILVTGAAGKTGRAVIRALKARGADVRAFVGTSVSLEAASALGADETSVGDLRDAGAVRAAVAGATGVYHIAPNVHPDEVAIGQNVIAAAREAALARVVFHSVLHPGTEKMPHHWAKLRVEEALFESGLPYTILQPAPYMQNLMTNWAAITREGVYRTPYPSGTRLSLVDLEDVAEVAARVLTETGHLGATYELCGTPGLSQIEVAAILSGRLITKVRAVALRPAEWERQAREHGLSDHAIATLLAMFDYYRKFGLSGNPNVLRWLLGREPGTLAAFVDRAIRGR